MPTQPSLRRAMSRPPSRAAGPAAEAERDAIRYPRRARLVREQGDPHAGGNLGPPEPAQRHALVTGSSPGSRERDDPTAVAAGCPRRIPMAMAGCGSARISAREKSRAPRSATCAEAHAAVCLALACGVLRESLAPDTRKAPVARRGSPPFGHGDSPRAPAPADQRAPFPAMGGVAAAAG